MKANKLELIYGKDAAQKVLNSKILAVGAGGIGCELMKTLSMTGFKKITIIDLDTIDVSNLNRQFLFRREHVDKSKAEVVRDQIKQQNPSIEVNAFVGKIQDEKFGFRFFSTFDVVINALDNEEARKHVNMQCFNLGIPLVDSGTNGYAAQCIPICKGKTPCYQCVERPKDQSFPVCTIRQKPEKLIHCIVWAKALFEGLFGPKENSTNIIQDIIDEIVKEGVTDPILYSEKVFQRVFHQEVDVLLVNLNARLQKNEMPSENSEADQQDLESDKEFVNKIKLIDFTLFKESIQTQLQDPDYSLNKDQLKDSITLKILNLEEQIYTFVQSIVKIHEQRKEMMGNLTFNKDDDLIIDFVSSATNIRAHNFSIPMESKFKIKEMAGKIIPAISSSNALVAALQVSETIKILTGNLNQLQGIVYQRLDKMRLQSYTRVNDDPYPQCEVCQDDSKFIYSVDVRDLSTLTLKDFVAQVLDSHLNLKPGYVIEFNENILYDSTPDQDDEDDMEMFQRILKKTLTNLKIKDLSKLLIQGAFQDQEIDSQIYVEINHDSNLTQDFKVTQLKKGILSLKQESKKNQHIQSNDKGKEDAQGNVCLSDDEEVQIDDILDKNVGIKRAIDPNTVNSESLTSVGDANKRLRLE